MEMYIFSVKSKTVTHFGDFCFAFDSDSVAVKCDFSFLRNKQIVLRYLGNMVAKWSNSVAVSHAMVLRSRFNSVTDPAARDRLPANPTVMIYCDQKKIKIIMIDSIEVFKLTK